MKINKNILLEYLYLTIFVITLFVLKELIEYVFFTRKRNNVIEKFSDPPNTCGIIEWYYNNYANINKIFDNISFIYTPNDPIPRQIVIKCKEYTEIKTVTDDMYSRIVLEPSKTAIYFEKFTIETTNDTVSPVSCFAIKIRNDGTNEFLDFIKYNYDTSNPTFDSDSGSCSFDSSDHDNEIRFAIFDTSDRYSSSTSINEAVENLLTSHN